MKRVLTGLSLGAVWLATIYSGSLPLFLVVIGILATIALYEYFTITLGSVDNRFRKYGIILGLLPLLGASCGRIDALLATYVATLLLLTLFLFAIYDRSDDAFILVVKFCSGITFIGLLAAHLLLLLSYPEGTAWLFILTAITISSDTGAYYAGVNFGRHKLCPNISPGKTIEGFVGGMLSSAVAALACAAFLLPDKSMLSILLLTLAVTAIGVTGDLLESIMKRGNQVKDSGSILPGHGGVLDRIDSMLASAPALFYAVHFGLV